MDLVQEYPWQPAMHPVCYLCGASKQPDTAIIDTKKYIEFEGWMHICSNCWGDGARLLGWSDPTTNAAQLSRIETLNGEIDGLREEITKLTQANHALASGVLESAFSGKR